MIRRSETVSFVYVADSDPTTRYHLRKMFDSKLRPCITFRDGASILEEIEPSSCGCIICAVRLPDMSGLTVIKELRRRESPVQTIITADHTDISTAVAAMKLGAYDFVEKPLHESNLFDSTLAAVRESEKRSLLINNRNTIIECYKRLSAREHEVLLGVVAGKSNKMIAHELSISSKTVEGHRGQMMHKMEAASVAELVHMAFAIDLLSTTD